MPKHPKGCYCARCKAKRRFVKGIRAAASLPPSVTSRKILGQEVMLKATLHGKPIPGRWTVKSVLGNKVKVQKGKTTLGVLLSDVILINPAFASARAEYEAKHWGIPAKGARQVKVPSPKGSLVEMGTLKGVMYETEKKGDGPSVYVHEFEGKRPKLAFDQSKKKRLFIVGGTYDVKDRGIEG